MRKEGSPEKIKDWIKHIFPEEKVND